MVMDGRKVNGWREKCIPLPSSLKPFSPMRHNWPEAKVADLIDFEKCKWNIELLKQTLHRL